MKKVKREFWKSHGSTQGEPRKPKGYRKRNKIDEDSPKSEKIARKWGWGKEDMYGPNYEYIRRFLASNVGRPWRKVHSELVSKFSGYNRHEINYAVSYLVEQNCYEENGVVYDSCDLTICKTTRYRKDKNGKRRFLRAWDFWVDKVGILRRAYA